MSVSMMHKINTAPHWRPTFQISTFYDLPLLNKHNREQTLTQKVNQSYYVTLNTKNQSQGHSQGDLIKVYTIVKYCVCNPKHDQEQTLTHKLTKVTICDLEQEKSRSGSQEIRNGHNSWKNVILNGKS